MRKGAEPVADLADQGGFFLHRLPVIAPLLGVRSLELVNLLQFQRQSFRGLFHVATSSVYALVEINNLDQHVAGYHCKLTVGSVMPRDFSQGSDLYDRSTPSARSFETSVRICSTSTSVGALSIICRRVTPRGVSPTQYLVRRDW